MEKKNGKEVPTTKDRHSSKSGNATHSGSPKKGGGGGKGTWGKGGIDDLKTTTEDAKDPNYDSQEETPADTVIEKVEIQNPIEAILKEYFVAGEVSDLIKSTKEVKGIDFIDLVRKAVTLSMERQPYDRELASELLVELIKSSVVSTTVIEDGFQRLLDRLDDTVLDVPDAAELTGRFLARALFDEIVAPAFLTSVIATTKVGKEAVGIAHGLFTEHHKSKHLEHIWGPGDLESVKRLKQEVESLIDEFVANSDYSEADKAIRNLNAPSFHFQLVKIALRKAIVSPEDKRGVILKLLAFTVKEGLIVPDHVTQGFKLSKGALEDIKLDMPSAPTIFPQIVKQAQTEGWLSVDFN